MKALLGEVWQDGRTAIRMLRHRPVVTLTVVLTLAIGIGASGAILGIADGILRKPLPYKDPERLVRIVETVPAGESRGGVPARMIAMDVWELSQLQTEARTLSHVAGYGPVIKTLTGAGDARRVTGALLSPDIFPMLGAGPLIGRVFELAAGLKQNEAQVVLSQQLWHQLFDRRPDVIGSSLTLDGTSYQVIGVMPASFTFPDAETLFWIPLSFSDFVPSAPQRLPAIARLAEGLPLETAQRDVRAILSELRGYGDEPEASRRFELVRLRDALVAPMRPALRLLTMAVMLVLIIACVNVATLLLAQTTSRAREMAIRRAIGAGQLRLVRQVVTECGVLALVGGGVGAVLAGGAIQGLRGLGATLPRRDLGSGIGIPRIEEISIDIRTLAFTLAASVAAALLVGLIAAFSQSRFDTLSELRAGESHAHSRSRLRGVWTSYGSFVAAQVALALVLLIDGALLMSDFMRLSAVSPGYDASNLITFQVTAPGGAAASSAPMPAEAYRIMRFAEAVTARVESAFQTRAVGYALNLPMVQMRMTLPLSMTSELPSRSSAPSLTATPELPDSRPVSQNFLQTMGVPLLSGRWFRDSDRPGQQEVILINRALASSGYLGKDPVGRHVYLGGRPVEVIGVVDDVRQFGLDQAPTPQVYVDFRQLPAPPPPDRSGPYFVLRTTASAEAAMSTIRQIVQQLDPDAVVDNVATMRQLLANSLSQKRLSMLSMIVFACVALLVALIGVYTIVAFAVTRRTREIGVRMALGAQRLEVLRLILKEIVAVISVGLLLGLLGAASLSGYLKSLLFETSATDSRTFIAASTLLACVAIIGALVPALAATRVDPTIALRTE